MNLDPILSGNDSEKRFHAFIHQEKGKVPGTQNHHTSQILKNKKEKIKKGLRLSLLFLPSLGGVNMDEMFTQQGCVNLLTISLQGNCQRTICEFKQRPSRNHITSYPDQKMSKMLTGRRKEIITIQPSKQPSRVCALARPI